MGRISSLPVLAGLCVLFSCLQSSFAYTPTRGSNGVQVRWKGAPQLYVAGNPRNQSGLGDQQVFDAIVRGLQRWKQASGGSVNFDYWQGTDPANYVAGSSYDGLSAVYFASNSKADSNLSPNVLGLTQVWYDTQSGEILETDIVLNDRNFVFTTDPRDTSGYGTGVSGSMSSYAKVFIENVMTHELGHALGLSHSGGLQSTMLFMESPEQAYLGCDELTAMHALYPADAGSRGALSGRIVSSSGSPVFGAHVLAISRRRGTVLASGITDSSGRYRIDALEPGSYFLLAEPFFAGTQTLPPYYSGARSDVCAGGRSFGRTALTGGDGFRLQEVVVGAGSMVGAPDLAVHCSDGGGAAIVGSMTLGLSASAPVIFDGRNRAQGGFGITDRMGSNDEAFYRLESVSGRLEVHVLSYSLYSPIRPVLALSDSFGNSVPVEIHDTVYEGSSGFVNFDSSLVAENLPNGSYTLQIVGLSLDMSLYPAGPVAVDSTPFFVVTGSINEGVPALAQVLPENARCRMTESFGAYRSPPGGPVRHSIEDGSGIGFCGTIEAVGSKGASSNRSGPGAAQIAGWGLPYLLAALAALALRKRRAYAKMSV